MRRLSSLVFVILNAVRFIKASDRSCGDYPPVPQNGKVFCSDGKSVGSKCILACGPYMALNGTEKTECIATSNGTKWSNSGLTTCEPERCVPFNTTMKGVFVSCTRGNEVTSICDFKCSTPGDVLQPIINKRIRCLRNKTWSGKPPCCSRPCPPHNVMDAYFVLDASESAGVNGFISAKEFVRTFASVFKMSSDTTRISVMMYNSEVDVKNVINLNDYLNDIPGFVYALDSLPYNGSEKGLNTGKALQYLVNNMMSPDAGNRLNVRDVVMIFTSRKPDDDVLTASFLLHATEPEVFVVSRREWYRSDVNMVPPYVLQMASYKLFNIMPVSRFEDLLLMTTPNANLCTISCQQDGDFGPTVTVENVEITEVKLS